MDKPTNRDGMMRRLVKALYALGDDPMTVARFLKQHKITGMRRRVSSCPVANYLERELGQTVKISLQMASTANPEEPLGPPIVVMLPSGVYQFVQRFDEGFYPTLMRKSKPVSQAG